LRKQGAQDRPGSLPLTRFQIRPDDDEPLVAVDPGGRWFLEALPVSEESGVIGARRHDIGKGKGDVFDEIWTQRRPG
jgi:hypothetical protein